MCLPSPTQRPPSASVEITVSWRESPEGAPDSELKPAIHICEPPTALDVYRMLFPSGEKRPRSSPACPLVICFDCPPTAGTIQRCGFFVFSSRFTSTAENMTQRPSGDTCGVPTRFSAIISSKVNGCFQPEAL